MKTKLIALTIFLTTGIWSQAQLVPLDTTTINYVNTTSAPGTRIWIVGGTQGSNYTAIAINAPLTGDQLPSVRVKVNANEAYLQGEIAGAISNTPQQNPVVVSLQTNLWASQSN